MTVFPVAAASIVVIDDALLIVKLALTPCERVPVPARDVATVNAFELMRVTPVTVVFGIDNVPFSTWLFVSKVCIPEPALKVPLLVIPPRNVTAALALLFHVPPVDTVTSPVNAFAPPPVIANVPLLPPPTVVVPPTLKAFAVELKLVPFPTVRFPPILNPATVTVAAVPDRVKSPATTDVLAIMVFVPLPDKTKFQ